MKFKYCPKCGVKLDESYKFCPECGLDLLKEEDKNIDTLIEKNIEERQKEALEDFKKSVLEVAEAFFAMSKEEREAMVEYVQDKCDEAEAEAKSIEDDDKHQKYD